MDTRPGATGESSAASVPDAGGVTLTMPPLKVSGAGSRPSEAKRSAMDSVRDATAGPFESACIVREPIVRRYRGAAAGAAGVVGSMFEAPDESETTRKAEEMPAAVSSVAESSAAR